MRNYKEEYQLWLDSPNLSEKSSNPSQTMKKRSKAAFLPRLSSAPPD